MALPAAGAGWIAWAIWAAKVISYAIMAYSAVQTIATWGKRSSMSAMDKATGLLVNTCDSQRILPLVYGRARIGINRVYTGVSGKHNKYLHIIGTLCEGPIKGIAVVNGVPQVWINDRLYTEFGEHVYYEFYRGTSDQGVCATLHADIPEWNDPLRYAAYIYVRLKWDMDKFQSLPEITVQIEGTEVLNPTTGATEYSRNGSLVLRDFLTRPSQRAGMGISAARLNAASFASASAYCAAKGWTCDLVLSDDAKAAEYLEDIMATFRGTLLYSMTDFVLKYRDMNYESSVMDITEHDIVSGSLTVTQPNVFDTPNAVEISYINDEKKFQTDSYTFSDAAAIESDGGDYRAKAISLFGISTETNAQKMAWYWLERLRQNKEGALDGAQRLLALDPMDLVRLTHSRYGWENKYFRVTETRCSPDGDVNVALIEEDIRLYDDVYNLSDRTWHDTTLLGPLSPVPSVENATLTEELYEYRGRTFTRLKLDFDPPSDDDYPFWDYAEIWVKIGSTGDWKFMTKSSGDYQLDPVEEGKDYYFKLVSVSIFGTRQPDLEALIIDSWVYGKIAKPADPSNFSVVVAGDTITIRAAELEESDIAGYELRMGDAWRGGLYVGFNETPNFRFVGVRPGTHTFWLAARGNNGEYSENPASAVAIVYYPPGYTDKNSWAWDFDAIGTHDNTEHVTHNTVDALKCSHTGEILSGTWLSPEYDLGSVKTVRVWGDFLTDFILSTATWDGVFGTAFTWEEKIIPTLTRWASVMSTATQGRIAATVYWGDATGSLTNSADGFELLAAEFSARYVQVAVTITDPTLDSNLYLYSLNMKAAYWQ